MRGFLGLIVGLALGVALFWAYLTYTIAAPDDRAWLAINSRLPAQMREWSCVKVKTRLASTATAPLGCEDFWK
jgi:hypothetical protein